MARWRSCLVVAACVVSTVMSAVWSAGPAGAAAASSYIVVLQDRVDVDAKVALLQRARGLTAVFRYRHALKGFAARLTPAEVALLAADPDIAFLTPDRTVEAAGGPVLPGDSAPTGVRRIDAAQNGQAGGASTANVAVIDTGIDLGHPDLNAVAGTNCVNPDAPPQDDHGHGTHVAGTIAARNNGSGVVGIVPGTKVYAVKVIDSTGFGALSQLICGIDWVTGNSISLNLRVANMSLVSSGTSDTRCGRDNADALHAAICNSTAAGITYAAAAGNSATNLAGNSPANYPEVLAVTAVSDSDGLPGAVGGAPSCRSGDVDDARASFSNFAVSAGDVAHTVAGPGVCIMSTSLNGGFAVLSGTSMASPHVAASIARCLGTDGSAGPCAGLSPAQIIQRVRSDAANHTTAIAGYGFAGDPLHQPASGRYFGYLAWDGVAAVPASPGLTATAGNAKVTLNWTAPSNGGSPITNYRIYRGTASGGETLRTTVGNVATFTDTGLTKGTTYYYRVSAVNAAGEGAPSAERSAAPKACLIICF